MAFEWDPEKALINARKHGVLFSTEAVSVFEDENAITIADYESDPGEERLITIGISMKGRTIVVAYTHRGDQIRIISARQATRHEHEQYEERQ
ncbi:MAG: BrnT family toxin [Bryobacteraceae bacterium]